MCGFIAQLVEQRTGNAEVQGANSVEALIFPLMSRNACNGENGETGEKSPAAGDLNWMPKVAPWRLAILAKMAILAKLEILAKIARGLAICGKIFKLDAKSGPYKVDN